MGNDGIPFALGSMSEQLVAGPSRLASAASGPPSTLDKGSTELLSGVGQSINAQAERVLPAHWNPATWSEGEVNDFLWNYRTIVAAGTASLVSTAASFPVSTLHWRGLERCSICTKAHAYLRDTPIV